MDLDTLKELHNIADNMILGNMELAYKQLGLIIEKENKKEIKCPLCSKEMNSFELTHYKCKKCNEYFTN